MKQQFPAFRQHECIAGYIFLFAQLFLIPIAVVLICEFAGISQLSTQQFFCFLSNFIFAAVLFPHYWAQSIKSTTGKVSLILRTTAIYLAVYYFSSILINFLIFTLDPEFMNANDSAISSMTSESFPLMAIGIVLLVPPVEELLFRGVVFGQLYNTHPILAYIVSALVFSAIHVVGYIGSVPIFRLLLSLLQYIPISLCLARAYEKTGSIFAPVLIHSIINFIGVLSM